MYIYIYTVGGGGDRKVCDEEAAAAQSSSPNSAASSFQMDFSIFRSAKGKRDFAAEAGEADRGGSDEETDHNGMGRKKLRLSKDQSAFLEESFKEHNTLNPVSI